MDTVNAVSSDFKVRDGTRLTLTHFVWDEAVCKADGEAERGDVLPPLLLVHGYGEHMGRYAECVVTLQRMGFDVWGYDARGHGLSDGDRGVMHRDDAFIDDFVELFEWVKRVTGRAPVVIGHSMGGLVVALAVTQKHVKPAALVLSSPALRVHMGLFQKALLKVGLCLFPDRALTPPAVNPIYLSHDAKVVLQYQTDPLVHRRISPRMAKFICTSGDQVRAHVEAFDMPTLLMYAGSDHVVDASGSDALATLLKAQHANRGAPIDARALTIHCYRNAYHEIFNESEPERTRILADLTGWLTNLIKKT
ncbi:Monoacylglycerol lipase [Ephemeroptericola cinctiostellae]|uniref:Monoacylglycerol lipase n=1 Tax=Ephemeroptericola cinctiostellae TaxID=2268024 RepID=A0A345DAG2_9BURK|nr:alpha/beta hydrolase [Ephemeroptericola cinctiostellae]AXF85350.1 Monoacylglycerol lipase [Ephemeroptericola cinctiostellae]